MSNNNTNTVTLDDLERSEIIEAAALIPAMGGFTGVWFSIPTMDLKVMGISAVVGLAGVAATYFASKRHEALESQFFEKTNTPSLNQLKAP